MRPVKSAVPVVPPVNRSVRSEGCLSALVEENAEVFTAALKGVTPTGGAVDTPTQHTQRLGFMTP